MCGRYTLATPVGRLAEEFGFDTSSKEFRTSYNVAPTQQVPAVLAEGGRGGLRCSGGGSFLRGLTTRDRGAHDQRAQRDRAGEALLPQRLPQAALPDTGRRLLRVEAPEREQAALLLPHRRGRPFAFAGLWENWNKDGEIRSCAILTTTANDLVEEIHERMPVILPRDRYDAWLDPEAEEEELAALLVPYPGDDLEAYPVSRFVNSPGNDDPRCIEPAA
jgi:putative SOS response-associated peptidase YedK